MANITCEVTGKFQLDCYENVLKTYEWIKLCCKSAMPEKQNLIFSCNVNFKAGNMRYSCTGIEDFKEHAFNETIEVSSFIVLVRESNNYIESIADIWGTGDKKDLTVSSNSKTTLANLIEEMKRETSFRTASSENTIVQDNSIHIQNSTIIKNSTIKDSTIMGGEKNTVSKLEKAKETFASKAFWQIVIPIAVSVIAGIILLIMEVSN